MKNTNDNSCIANTLDWNPLADLIDTDEIAEAASPFLETEQYTSHAEYDAFNRPICLTTPDGSVNLPTYNEAGLLDKVQACLRGASVDDTTPFVTNINYDAKGQRELVEYANGIYTEYTYDPLTFRVIRILTIRTKDNACLQDLNYTYDPVGNITELRDNAQKTIFYDNARVEPVNRYEYDALYRLIHTEGREHAGQNPNAQPGHHNPPIINTPHPNDAQAMRNYTEDYVYDEVGNILCMDHNFANGGWKRNYQYEDVSNRLESTSLPGDDPEGPYGAQYGYDAHGNMTGMPHLQQMCWDFKDQMCQVDLGGGGTAYYIYDARGQRARKVHEHNGSTMEERIYLGGYEIYRKHNGTGLTLERETLHIMDDQQRIALVETKTVEDGVEVPEPEPLVRYQLNNHLGSSSMELDENGEEISYEEYYPYGSTSYQWANSKISQKRYRYTGKERDDETGLYYYGARYYAAWLGRWVSCDPAIFKTNYINHNRSEQNQEYSFLSQRTKSNQKNNEKSPLDKNISMSPYNYVANNPIIFVDPDGKKLMIKSTEEEVDKIIEALEYISSTSLKYRTVWEDKSIKKVEIVGFEKKNPLEGYPECFKKIAEKFFHEEQNYLNQIISGYQGEITIISVEEDEVDSLALIAGPAAYNPSDNEVKLLTKFIGNEVKGKWFYTSGGIFSSSSYYDLWDVLAHELFGHAIHDIEYETKEKKVSRREEEITSRKRANRIREKYGKQLRCETCNLAP
jgi:RHS repeat-associated protein